MDAGQVRVDRRDKEGSKPLAISASKPGRRKVAALPSLLASYSPCFGMPSPGLDTVVGRLPGH
jgi:hypothetical protein